MTAALKDKIVDCALELADKAGWEAVRLHDIAAALGITLDDIRGIFREKEDLTDAWFDRADRAMLAAAAVPEFAGLDTRQRLHRLFMTWFKALAGHRRVTREMIINKLEPGHLHVTFPGLLRVSRTVQWAREGALRDATFIRRALEETGLTTIYLMSFAIWMYDDSPDFVRTARFLEHRLRDAECLSHRVFGRTSADSSKPVS